MKKIISKVTQAITKTVKDSFLNLEKTVAELKHKTEAENKQLKDKVEKFHQEMKEVVEKTNIYEIRFHGSKYQAIKFEIFQLE